MFGVSRLICLVFVSVAAVLSWIGSLMCGCCAGLPGGLVSLMGSSSLIAGRLSEMSMGAGPPPDGGAQGTVASMGAPLGGVEMWMLGTGVAA